MARTSQKQKFGGCARRCRGTGKGFRPCMKRCLK